MSLIQETLDKSLPFGQVFQGSGEQDPKDKECRYFQHGLYFDAQGRVLMNNEHNAKKIAQLRALEPDEVDPDVEQPEILTTSREPVSPKVLAAFQAKNDDEVFAAAKVLASFNKDNGVTDDYVPALEKRVENIRFIAKHAG